ncbi:uncharacterized protein BCR38DRAFT_489680 [Pseudomassariella vexata]|uniref:Uncharacterized protein n=1 Tax=Pseudomassariella vexata TaxID=1141098 RepID=A0A1Y2DFY3_9PEZI|nr:uncharacterized protein BCR38DRAFT_489680 [Pseudomassariella vexata]ORY58203.1 hypothetical protein BCR38DRAFT_489680 [Pseudomassariella vexata]
MPLQFRALYTHDCPASRWEELDLPSIMVIFGVFFALLAFLVLGCYWWPRFLGRRRQQLRGVTANIFAGLHRRGDVDIWMDGCELEMLPAMPPPSYNYKMDGPAMMSGALPPGYK